MIYRKLFITLILPLILITLDSTQVYACVQCVASLSDAILPPIFIWCLIAIVWFLGTAFIRSIYKVQISGVPGIIKAIGLFVLLFVVGASMLGPIVILPLIIAPAVNYGRSFVVESVQLWGPRANMAIKLFGHIMATATVVTLIMSIYIHATRTPGQFIVQWGGSSLYSFDELKRSEPQSLQDYRYIVENGNEISVMQAAKRIAEIGEPSVDIPKLEAALARLRAQSRRDGFSREIEDALEQLRKKGKDQLQ
jgi:hypothetical protein